MTTRPTPKIAARAAALTLLASVVALQACNVDSPVFLDESEVAVVQTTEIPAPGLEFSAKEIDIRDEPTFTPFTVAPSITNRDEIVRMMTEAYPPLLRDAGVGGTVRVYFFINEEGIVEQVRMDQTSGHAALDDAALNVAGAYRFSPARNEEAPVPVWVSFPITFQVR